MLYFACLINLGKNNQEHDIILLKHELMEANLMADDPSMVYKTAHESVQRKYNYGEALTEYLKNNNLESKKYVKVQRYFKRRRSC